MTKRQLQALKTRQKLIDTTEKLLSTKGFNAVGVEDITKEAGVAKGTFYVYFPHKEDIVTEICRGYFNKIKTDLEKMKTRDITEKLTVYFDNFMKAVKLYGINICREWIKGVIDPDNKNENIDKGKWAYDVEMLKSILNTAIKDNELKEDAPVELLTHIIISQLYGMMTVWCVSDGKFEPTEWTKKFAEFQLKKILKDYLK